MPGRMAASAPKHSRAPSARVVVRLDLPAVPSLCLICTAMQPCCMAVSSTVFLCFAFLDARRFLKPLIYFEIVLEVFLAIET